LPAVQREFPFKDSSGRFGARPGSSPSCSNRGILRILLGDRFEFLQCRSNALGDYVIAESTLFVHYSKVVIITVTKWDVRHHLVFALSSLNRPHNSAAWCELISANLPCIRQFPCIGKSIT